MEKTNVSPAAVADERKSPKNPETDYFSTLDFSKLEVKMEEMFKSGVHFGHHKSRKNPSMSDFIFTTKNNINIFDLEKTAEKLKEAMEFISKIVSEGKEILFVGTKKQAKKIVEEAAKTCQMPYITERWLGGTFTNFEVISRRAGYLRESEEKMKRGDFSKYTKFEQMKKAEELERLEKKMGGIKNMNVMPAAVLAVSVIEDGLAIKEAKIKGVPVVAFVDSNASPKEVGYPIPANEDAVSSIRLLMAYMVKAVLDGKNKKIANLTQAEEQIKSKDTN